MNVLTTVLAGLLRWVVVLLPAGRREWGQAVWAEAGDVPAGRVRLSCVVGGLWLVVGEAEMIRKIGYTGAGVAAGATMVWLDWHPGSSNPAVPTNAAASSASSRIRPSTLRLTAACTRAGVGPRTAAATGTPT